MQLSVQNIWFVLLLSLPLSKALMQLSMCYSMVVLSGTSSVSTFPKLTWMRMCLPQSNVLCMYAICVSKSGPIMVRRCRSIHLCRFSCTWLAVAYCLVSGSLLCCRLPPYHSTHVASKQLLVNHPLPPSHMQEMSHILCTQRGFLCLLTI